MKIKELYKRWKNWRERSVYGWIRGELSATEAKQKYEYGDYKMNLESVIKNTVLNIEDRIDQKCRDCQTSLAITFRDDQKQLMEGVIKHFKDYGFICKTVEFKTEIPGYIYLILGW